MTISVTDKTPIPDRAWRRHTDPPGLWIAVTIGSVSLHLLAFWLIRSSGMFRPLFSQQSQAAIPIEFVEISPEATPKTKIGSSKPQLSNKNSQATPRNQDSDTIDSGTSVLSRNQTNNSQTNTQLFPKKIISTPIPRTTVVPQPTPTATSRTTVVPQPRPTIPAANPPGQPPQQIIIGKGKPLPTNIPSVPSEQPKVTETRQGKPVTIGTEEIPRIPDTNTAPREVPGIPDTNTAPTRIEETPPTSEQGGAIATVAPLADNEVRQLVQAGRLRLDALPDVLATYKGSNTKKLASSFLPRNSGIKPAKFLASLIIDQNGNFQSAVVLEIEPTILKSETSLYEEVVNDIFKDENFLPAYNQDGRKPEESNLFMRITIEPVNRN